VIVGKRQRRLNGIDQIVLSLTARGLTTGEICAHFAEVYGASVSKDTISRITDKVIEEMTEWRHRPLDRVYPVLFIDALVVKVPDGQVVNRPIYVVIGEDCPSRSTPRGTTPSCRPAFSITAGLVDQFRLFVYPIVQGRGRRLFPEGVQLGRFRRLDAKAFRGGVTYSCYAPA
jgi:hypothetical protein